MTTPHEKLRELVNKITMRAVRSSQDPPHGYVIEMHADEANELFHAFCEVVDRLLASQREVERLKQELKEARELYEANHG